MKTILAVLFLTSITWGQAGFTAHADGSTGGSLSNHTICAISGCTPVDSRISTSMASGFTSPAVVTFFHVNGKDYATNSDFGSVNLGQLQFGTGSLLSGDLSSIALFDSDQSYVSIGGNGSCGQFKLDGTCKVGGQVPNSATVFVGVFEGRITWETNADLSHLIKGTMKGSVLGSAPVFLSFTCLTAPDSAPFLSNGHLQIQTVTVAPF